MLWKLMSKRYRQIYRRRGRHWRGEKPSASFMHTQPAMACKGRSARLIKRSRAGDQQRKCALTLRRLMARITESMFDSVARYRRPMMTSRDKFFSDIAFGDLLLAVYMAARIISCTSYCANIHLSRAIII